ncbi:MAG: mucoidy inhibitor MuiA family protein [Myxococcales bacterium]
MRQDADRGDLRRAALGPRRDDAEGDRERGRRPGRGAELATARPRGAHLAEIQALDQKIEALRARIREVELQRTQAVSSRAQGESLRATIPGLVAREAAAEPKPQTKAWAAALESSRRIIEAADERLRKADASLRELNRDLQELLSLRGALASEGPERAAEAEVLVRCKRAGTARVELSYMAGGVSWQPVYEARADQARKKVELAVLAQVVQATGEPWDGVQLILSTATTRRDATPPEPKRLYVGATPEDKKKVLVKRYEEVAHLSTLTTASGQQDGPAQAEDAGLSVRFEVPGKVSLPGDGRPMRLLVSRDSLPAIFDLLTVPKMAPFAFRRAELVNRTAQPLLPGRVDLFAGGSYLGHSRLEHVARGDRLELAFGIEEPVKVRRVVLTEQAKDPGFLGSTRKLNYGYRLEVASHAASPVEIKVQEHVPVSQLDDVKVVLGKKTTSGYDLAAEDGIVTWKVKLAPGEKRDIELHFAVEIPEEYDSSAL